MVEKEIEREPVGDEVAEAEADFDVHRQNKRAGVAIATGFEPVGEGEPREVRVRFELPHGEESFTQTFPLDAIDDTPELDELLEVAGLIPGVDTIGDLDGREVPVEMRYDGWHVDVKEEPVDGILRPSDEITSRSLRPLVSALGLASLIGTLISPVLLAVGLHGILVGSAASLLVLFPLLTIIAEAAYIGLGFIAYDVPSEGPPMLEDYHNYIESPDASFAGLLLLLVTSGVPMAK